MSNEREVPAAVIVAGMKEWDAQHKNGVRDWPAMLEAVYLAMYAAERKEHTR